MKKIIISSCISAAALAALIYLVATHRGNHWGVAFAGYPVVAVTDLVKKPSEFLKKPVRIEGIVAKQCPATGCWFYVRDANAPENGGGPPPEIKVEMGDTVPKIPRNVGKFATVEGQLIQYGGGYQFIGAAVTFSEKGAR